MNERPILFSGPMVRAILEGRKTQTRRIIKGATGEFWDHQGWRPQVANGEIVAREGVGHAGGGHIRIVSAPRPSCPYGKRWDTLWVREKFALTECAGGPCIVYAADGSSRYIGAASDERSGTWREYLLGPTVEKPYEHTYKPSIHMPRWASRITLEITSVSAARLQSISEADARAEGAGEGPQQGMVTGPVVAFADLWDSIHGTGAWITNPWVWVVEFKKNEG